MTIKQYLFNLERLYNRRENRYEKYMQLSARAISPGSSLNLDGTPRTKRTDNNREKILVEAGAALENFFKACDEYNDAMNEFDEVIEMLPFTEKLILYFIYIENRGKPYENRYSGICRATDLKRSQIPAKEKEAEKHLTEILRSRGVMIEE